MREVRSSRAHNLDQLAAELVAAFPGWIDRTGPLPRARFAVRTEGPDAVIQAPDDGDLADVWALLAAHVPQPPAPAVPRPTAGQLATLRAFLAGENPANNAELIAVLRAMGAVLRWTVGEVR